MKLNVGIALAVSALFSAPTIASDSGIGSRLDWAAEVGTHLYDVPNMEAFQPSLEVGLRASYPLVNSTAGRLSLDGGFTQSAIYGSSSLKVPQSLQGNSLEASQVDYRRVYVALSFETSGKWFVKPEVGAEHIVTKLRLYDPNTRNGYTNRETDSNVFASMGVGYHFQSGKKGVLSFATLGDDDGFQDYRITYTAYF